MQTAILSQEEVYTFEVFRDTYPTTNLDPPTAYKLLDKILNKIGGIQNKAKFFSKCELSLFELLKKRLKEKLPLDPQEIETKRTKLRNLTIESIKFRLSNIRDKVIEKVLKENNYSSFLKKIIYVTQMFEKIIELNENNYTYYKRFRSPSRYDKLAVICLDLYEFATIISVDDEKGINDLIFSFENLFTPQEISHYRKKLALASK